MSALSGEQIAEVLAKHRAWLNGQADGARANLSGADLSGADLSGANLSGADLSRANLFGANLFGANLFGVNLFGANLSGVKIFEHWKVETYRDLLWLGPLGSRNGFLMVNVPTLRLKAGCFEGTIEDFLTKVAEAHGENEYGREYVATVAYLKALVEARAVHA